MYVQVSTDDDPLIFVDMPSSQTKSILQKGMPDNLVSYLNDFIFCDHVYIKHFNLTSFKIFWYQF